MYLYGNIEPGQNSESPLLPLEVAADSAWYNALVDGIARAKSIFPAVNAGGTWAAPSDAPRSLDVTAPFGLSDSVSASLNPSVPGAAPVVVPLNAVAEAKPALCLAAGDVGEVGEVAPWGRGPFDQVGGALGWVQSHAWLALGVALGAGYLLHQKGKRSR
jgi:hypothetical protein